MSRAAPDDGLGALMDRLRAFQTEHPSIPGPVCRACDLPEKLRAFLVKAKAKRATVKEMVAVVASEGHHITRSSVERHLRGDCAKR